MTKSTIIQKPEVVLFYAEVPTDKISPEGNIIYTCHVFDTLKDAQKSGTDYHIATWNDINSLADFNNHYYTDKIIATPQGRFEWTEVMGIDYESGEMEVFECVYRYVGAPEEMSKAIESHLFHNKGSELIFVTDSNNVYTAHIQTVDGQIIAIEYTSIAEEVQQETTENIELAKYALVLTVPFELIGLTVGKTYPILINEINGEMYLIDDEGRENLGALMMCETMLFM